MANQVKMAPWVKPIARLGIAARGLVYATIGMLALGVSLRRGGETTGKEGAIETLANQPLGAIILIFLALGLLGFAIWRFVLVYQDPNEEAGTLGKLVRRGAFSISGLISLGAAYFALDALIDIGGDEGAERSETITAFLLNQPLGRWVVIFIGLIIIGAGFYQAYRSLSGKFEENLKSYKMQEGVNKWALWLGRAGIGARALLIGIIGAFFIEAGWRNNPEEAGGLDQALGRLAQQGYGLWLLGLTAVGLIAFGLYAFIEARYRKFEIE